MHSYRYAWAERALKCGCPERFTQQALGHNSKAVHHAYSKHAEVTVPSLDDWEKEWGKVENQKPKVEIKAPRAAVVQVNFQEQPDSGSVDAEQAAGAAAHGG